MAVKRVPFKRTVITSTAKSDDLEVHLSRVVIDGVTVLDIRDFILSTRSYGRGVTLPWTSDTEMALGVAADFLKAGL